MAKLITINDAITELGVINQNSEVQTVYNTIGVSPAQIATNTVEADYFCLGVTPQEFVNLHGSTTIVFADLERDFKTICFDYGDALALNDKSKAVEFCSRMIYEVGPEARKVSKRSGDKTWKFVFMYKDKDSKAVIKVAFVSTYKKDNAEYKQALTADSIILSVKNACLLAITTLEKLNEISVNMTPSVLLLTPLAGSIFSKEDVAKIANDLSITQLQAINVINASCQSGGHYLEHSTAHCAAVAAIVATKNVKDKKLRDGIIGKTMKQYIGRKKKFNQAKFEVYCHYGHGGVPSNLSPDNLIQLFEAVQRVSPMAAVTASQQTAVKTTVAGPSNVATKATKPTVTAPTVARTPSPEPKKK